MYKYLFMLQLVALARLILYLWKRLLCCHGNCLFVIAKSYKKRQQRIDHKGNPRKWQFFADLTLTLSFSFLLISIKTWQAPNVIELSYILKWNIFCINLTSAICEIDYTKTIMLFRHRYWKEIRKMNEAANCNCQYRDSSQK